jgi:Autotransporter beta-domain
LNIQRKYLSMKIIKVYRKSTFALMAMSLLHAGVYAQTCPSGDPLIISSSCTNLYISSAETGVSIDSGVSVATSLGSNPAAIEIAPSVNVTTFTNNGNIIGYKLSIFDSSGLILNSGSSIGTLTNSAGARITSSAANNSSTYNAAIKNDGSITTLNNSGGISASSSGLAYGVVVGGAGQIGTLNNYASGTIVGQLSGVIVSGTINTLNNAGAITGGVAGNSISKDGIWVTANGLISTINNTGSIAGTGSGYSINNQGAITTLSNQQSGLTYSGTLPTNYNIITKSLSQYGQATFSNVSGVPMKFGFGPNSSITTDQASYSNVLSGVTSSNLANTSGSIGGGITVVRWALTNVSGSSTDWNLGVNTPLRADAPRVTRSSAATSQAGAMTYTYNSVMSGAIANPTLANGATLSSAVQSLTTSDVNQLTQVHAEGYSSNMTIGLEQMAHITNTVMDRIHAPMSASPSTKVYQDDEGRYIWADAAAVKGTVNNYNNLAGFGYNLYDLIIGGDISRSKEGGYGVFAGTGSTSMTESQQVTQNFNTTNFYAGLYGARNFDAQVKLSGALGYMYGNTNANRNTPNVGLFTGGNATSSYKTNGMYAAAKLAKAYQAESFTISPFVGASYSQLWMGGASEQGGNDFNFAISSATAYTAVTFAGLDFVYPLLKGTNDPLSLIGFYKLGYDWYANSNSAHSITATSPTYGSFTQVGANMGPVSNMIGLGIQGGITKEVSARIGAVASYNTYGHEYGGGAELRFKF